MEWSTEEVADCLNCEFRAVDSEPGFDLHQASFQSRGLLYLLEVDQANDHLWLRADPNNPNTATPAFEFTFKADRIVVRAGDYHSNAVSFENTGRESLSNPKGIQLVIDCLPSGDFYIWPVIGESNRGNQTSR